MCQWRRSSGASSGTTTSWPSPGGISWSQPGQRYVFSAWYGCTWRTSTGPSGSSRGARGRQPNTAQSTSAAITTSATATSDDVAAALHLLPERVEAHAATVAADGSDLLVERADGVVTLTLNRPEKKNAITGEMWRGLIEVFDEVATNPDDRVLVITGAGDGFCSGADLADAGDCRAAPGVGRALARRCAWSGGRRCGCTSSPSRRSRR